MLEVIKFKSILKKNKNVFKDIINDMTIKSLKGNNIIFIDSKGNEIISEINDSNIIFRFDDKKNVIVNLPQDDKNECVKVVEVVKEERDNGCVIEVIEKNYDFTIESDDEKVLVDLISNRYVFDKNISIYDINNFEQLCNMKTTFESHFKTLLKPVDSLRWYTDSPYSTYTKINGEDISYIYDIFLINLGLLRKSSLGYKETSGITAKENEICGKCKKRLSSQEITFIYNLINKKIGYKKQFDIYDINSIIEAITYKKTVPERAKDSLERELGIPYEEFNRLDYDEQHKILKSNKHRKLISLVKSYKNNI